MAIHLPQGIASHRTVFVPPLPIGKFTGVVPGKPEVRMPLFNTFVMSIAKSKSIMRKIAASVETESSLMIYGL